MLERLKRTGDIFRPLLLQSGRFNLSRSL
jgi:hypothetical protein